MAWALGGMTVGISSAKRLAKNRGTSGSEI
jgi:hypothetical protein